MLRTTLIPRTALILLGLAAATAAGAAEPAGPAPDALALVTADASARWQPACAGPSCRSEIVLRIDARRILLRLWLGRTADGVPVLAALAPLGLHLADGVGVSLDGGHSLAAVLPLIDCGPEGCRAAAPASPDLVTGLSTAAAITVIVRDARTHSRLGLQVPMTGFRDALVPMMLRR